MKTQRTDDDQRLRELLRQGDPAHDEGALDPREVARMRRELLSRAAERGSQLPFAGWRTAAVVACLAIGVLVVLYATEVIFLEPKHAESARQLSTPIPPGQGSDEDRAPGVALSEATEPAPEPVTDTSVQPLHAETAPSTEQVEPIEIARYDSTDPRTEDTRAEPPQTRTIHFTAQGGTQIIWTLDPELEL
jgi:hypothetical protein